MKLNISVTIALVGQALSGLSLFIGALFGLGYRVSPALGLIEYPTKFIVGGFIFVGSVLAILASMKYKKATTNWKLAMIGLPIGASGWGLYTVSLILTDPFALFPIYLSLGLACAFVINLFEVIKDEANTRKHVEDLHNE